MLLAQGKAADAEEYARAAQPILAAMPVVQLSAFSTLCLILLALGRVEEARLLVEEGLAILDSVKGVGFSEVDFLTTAAEVQYIAGDIDKGRQTILRTLERIRVRAEKFPDLEMRRRYEEEFIENRRARSLATKWLEKSGESLRQ